MKPGRKPKSALMKMGENAVKVDSREMLELMFVRYMGIALKHLKGDEAESLRFCCEVFGFDHGSGVDIWVHRNQIIARNEADFIASDDILKGKIRGLYIKLVDSLTSRDYSAESVKSVIEALRAVASLELGVSISRGIALDDGHGSNGNIGGVQVSRSNVIIVPMPDSANNRVREVGDRLVSNEVMSGGAGGYFEGMQKNRKEALEHEEKMLIDTQLDLVEEFKKVESRMINGEDE